MGAGYVSLRLDSGRIELAATLLLKVCFECEAPRGVGFSLVSTWKGCVQPLILVTLKVEPLLAWVTFREMGPVISLILEACEV